MTTKTTKTAGEHTREVASQMIDTMEDILRADGEAMAVCLIEAHDGKPSIIGVPMPDQKTKDAAFEALRLTAVAQRAMAMVFVAESWQAEGPLPEGRQVMDMETRKEVVTAVGAYFDEAGERHVFGITCDIVRADDGSVARLDRAQPETPAFDGKIPDIFPAAPPTADAARAAALLLQLRGIELEGAVQ